MMSRSLRRFGQFNRSSFKIENNWIELISEDKLIKSKTSTFSLGLLFPVISLYLFGPSTDAINCIFDSSLPFVLICTISYSLLKDTVVKMRLSKDGKSVTISKLFNSKLEKEFNIKDIKLQKTSEEESPYNITKYSFEIDQTPFKILRYTHFNNPDLVLSILNSEEVEWVDN
jgi:hypothetical protein